MSNGSEFTQSLESSNQPLRAQVEARVEETRTAIQVLEEKRAEDKVSIQKALEEKIEAGDLKLEHEIKCLKELLEYRVSGLSEITQQYQEQQKYALEVATTEREKSASTLREEQARALGQAERERQKSADILKEALNTTIKSGDDNLRLHIDQQGQQNVAALRAQKDLSEQEFAASKEAIQKTERAVERQFESLRDLVDSKFADLGNRQDAALELLQSNSVRITEMEARGGGEKDQSSELKSSLAIGVAAIAVVASIAVGLVSALSV